MTSISRLLLTFAIITFSLAAGYSFRHVVKSGRLTFSEVRLKAFRKKLQEVAVYILLPLSAMLSLWGLPSPDAALLALPLLGVAAYITGGVLALLTARYMGLNRKQTGSLYCCGTFSNIGAIGGLVCVLFLGENSIALVALYRLLEEVFYFSVSFPVARWYGEKKACEKIRFSDFKFDPVLIVILCALILGIGLNCFNVFRPKLFSPLANGLMISATIFFLFSIGLSLKLSSLGDFIVPSVVVCAIKFIFVPLCITTLAAAIGFGRIEGGMPLKVVAVLSSMPVAMTALIPPSLFNLDLDLANSCWIFSTLCLIFVLPVIMIILPIL